VEFEEEANALSLCLNVHPDDCGVRRVSRPSVRPKAVIDKAEPSRESGRG
jgi:hypothetical protein